MDRLSDVLRIPAEMVDMVEGKLGAERSQDASASVGAVLLTLAENYRQRRIRST